MTWLNLSLQGRYNSQFPVDIKASLWFEDKGSICPSVLFLVMANSSCLGKSVSVGWASSPAPQNRSPSLQQFVVPEWLCTCGALVFWTPRSCLLTLCFLIWGPSYFIQSCLFCLRVFGEEPPWITLDNLICSCWCLLWNLIRHWCPF